MAMHIQQDSPPQLARLLPITITIMVDLHRELILTPILMSRLSIVDLGSLMLKHMVAISRTTIAMRLLAGRIIVGFKIVRGKFEGQIYGAWE